MKPKVTIVITTYNSDKFIKNCIISVQNQTYDNLDTVVIDNNSSDETISILDKCKDIKVIKNNRNHGVCMARNYAIQKTESDYILTLDSDMVLEPDYIDKLISASKTSMDKTGMYGGSILQMRSHAKIDTLGLILTMFYRFYDFGYNKEFKNFKIKSGKLLGPCACAALYEKKMLEDIKESDNIFFDPWMHYLIEDFDLAIRANKKGWKYRYVPGAKAYHYRHGSGLNSKFIQYLSFRNRYYLICKHFDFKSVKTLFLALIFYDTPRFIFMLAVNYKLTKQALKELAKKPWIKRR